MQCDLRNADLLQPVAQLVKALIEHGGHIRLRVRLEGQGGAPDAVALLLLAVAKKLGEAGDQVGLREHHVHRRKHFQAFGQFLHALAQVLGQVDGEFGAVLREFRHAHRHDDAVDGRLGAIALEQIEEAEPLAAVFFVHRVAAGRVEQDAFGGEEPVAVTRAADALDDRAALVGKRKLQAGIEHGRAFARRRVADHDVPGQLVQRRAARHLPELGTLDGLDGFCQAHAQGFHFFALVWCGGLVGGGLFQHAFELVAGLTRTPALPQIRQQPQGEQDTQRDADPDQANLEGLRHQQQEDGQHDHAKNGQRA